MIPAPPARLLVLGAAVAFGLVLCTPAKATFYTPGPYERALAGALDRVGRPVTGFRPAPWHGEPWHGRPLVLRTLDGPEGAPPNACGPGHFELVNPRPGEATCYRMAR